MGVGSSCLLQSLVHEAPTRQQRDKNVSLVVVFTVPEDKMEKFVNNFGEFYNKTKGGSEECVYYGFAKSGNKVMCREGYRSAAGVLQHLTDVKAPLDLAVGMVGEGGLQLWAVGP